MLLRHFSKYRHRPKILLEKHMAKSGTWLASHGGNQLDRCFYLGHLGSVGAVRSSVPCPRTAGSRGPSQRPLPCDGSSLQPRSGRAGCLAGASHAPQSGCGVSAAPACENTVYERRLCPPDSRDDHGRRPGAGGLCGDVTPERYIVGVARAQSLAWGGRIAARLWALPRALLADGPPFASSQGFAVSPVR